MDYDVLIAGAGPAGLSAAYAAARGGARVAVFEKSKEIGYPIHTSGGSWLPEMRKLGIPERFMHPIDEGVFVTTRARAEFKYLESPSCILDIRGLYQYLAEEASAVGAEIFVDSIVSGPVLQDGRPCGLRIRRYGRESILHAPLLIDASGCNAVLARKLGLSRGLERFGVGAEYDLYAPHWPRKRVAFAFGSEFAPAGYAWLFPHGNRRLRAGVGLIRPDTQSELRAYLERILHSDIFGDHLKSISRIEFHTGIIPSTVHLARTVTDGAMVVGDAGALISTLLGEGIRFAIDIGRMAGAVAADAVAQARYDRDFLSRYEVKWRRRYERVFQIGSIVNRRLASYTDEQWHRRIQLLARLKPEILPILLKGDLNGKNLVKVFRGHPEFFSQTMLAMLRHKLKFT